MPDRHTATLDQTIVARYSGQPVTLPPDLRRIIEAGSGGAPVQLYALADLDASLRLAEIWVTVLPDQVALARRHEGQWEITAFSRRRLTAVRESPGLSASTLTFLGAPGEPALGLVRYTHRQRRAFENLRYLLEDGEAEAAPDQRPVDPDLIYAQAVAGPVREAQALVAGHQTAAIRRLLGYLRPYRRELTLGLSAATVITLVSLIPPWLAGYVLDRLVAPVRAGTLALGRATTLAWVAVSAMALVYLIRQGAALIRLRLMAIMGEWVARDLRTQLYEHLQRLSLSFYARKRTGGLITRVVERHRSALGLPRLRGRGRVALVGDAAGSGPVLLAWTGGSAWPWCSRCRRCAGSCSGTARR